MNLVTGTLAWLADGSHWAGGDGILTRLVEHVELSTLSMLIAVALALPVGLWIGHTRRGATVAVNVANIFRAVPTLALIGLILPFTQAFDPGLGFSTYPTLFAMIVLATPPILVNAYVAISEVDADIVEAARGMGFRDLELLRRIEIPLALPVILGGIRSASVQVIATVTLGAIFGFGGFGRFVVDGIAQNDDGQLFGGVVLVAALATASEVLFVVLQRVASRAPKPQGRAEPFTGPGEAATAGGEG
jgi:osmoprotectant transport system permease protein